MNAHQYTKRHQKHVHHSPPHVATFVQMALPAAQRVSAKYGVPVSVVLAQSAQESGWGLQVKNNAYFGVKGHAPNGASATIATHEVVDGKSVAENQTFRAYDGYEDAADDYAHTLSTRNNFKAATLHKNDPSRFVDELVKGGYATDPHYKKKIMNIIHTNHLDQYDK